MNSLRSYIGQIIEVEISSKKKIVGKLLELGSDLNVLFDGQKYVYVPIVHLLSVSKGNRWIQSTPIKKQHRSRGSS